MGEGRRESTLGAAAALAQLDRGIDGARQQRGGSEFPE
jgi:hypothetical protein